MCCGSALCGVSRALTHSAADSRPSYSGTHDFDRRGMTVCPEWHNSVVFISWIEENISPRPEQRYPSGCLVYTLDREDNDKN